MSVATRHAIMLLRVKLVWLDLRSIVAAATATNAVRISVGERLASVMELPSSSSSKPSGTEICRLPCPKGVACNIAAKSSNEGHL